MDYDKEPVLDLDTPHMIEMGRRLSRFNNLSNMAYSSQQRWRDKASYKKKAEAMGKEIAVEKARLLNQYAKDLSDYREYLVEMEKAEKSFQAKSPIETISISEPVYAKDKEVEDRFEINPIMDIEL